MRLALASIVLAACSQPAPQPPKAPSQQIVRSPVSSVPTCADMGPLLRGSMTDEDEEGPKKEAIIVASCEHDRWPTAVLACVASATEPTAFECLTQLPPELHARYDKALEKYGRTGEEDHDKPPPEEPATCDETLAATALDLWRPAVSEQAERQLAIKLRGEALRRLCEDQHWPVEAKKCITETPASDIDACLLQLGDARSNEMKKALLAADGLRMQITKAKPASATCDKAVNAHYGEVKWKGKAPELKGADRTKAIKASRKAMTTACGGWSIEARACIVLDDGDACYGLAGSYAAAWGYPAAGTTSTLPLSGIPECDDYAKAIEELRSCNEIAKETKDAVDDAYRQAAAAWASLPPEGREAAKTACRSAADAMRQAASGCT